MATSIHRETAKIYAFPVKVRGKVDGRIVQEASVVALASKRTPNVSYDAWYHEEAMQEAARDKAN